MSEVAIKIALKHIKEKPDEFKHLLELYTEEQLAKLIDMYNVRAVRFANRVLDVWIRRKFEAQAKSKLLGKLIAMNKEHPSEFNSEVVSLAALLINANYALVDEHYSQGVQNITFTRENGFKVTLNLTDNTKYVIGED